MESVFLLGMLFGIAIGVIIGSYIAFDMIKEGT